MGIFCAFSLELEQTTPFIRKIHLDEIWLYKNPRTTSYVPTSILWLPCAISWSHVFGVGLAMFVTCLPLVFMTPTLAIVFHFIIKRNKVDLCQGLLSLSLALGLNGIITDTIKVVVGRPRPDFFYRCFPDGEADLESVTDIGFACKGEAASIIDGRKSFPSGHASFSFCSLGFLSLWLCGKMGVFRGARSEGWRLIVVAFPLMVALVIALSRTCDYHHHWQDVFVGSVIGLLVSYLCYRQYYPHLSSSLCHLPYLLLPSVQEVSGNFSDLNIPLRPNFTNGRTGSHSMLCDPEIPVEEQVKWI